MKHILLDSDVLLDYFLDRAPHNNYSEQLLKACETGKIRGYVTAVAIGNLYYILAKSISTKDAKDCISLLMDLLEVAIIDKKVVLDALKSSFKDFEDGLQSFAGYQNKDISLVITRNIKDYKDSKLPVMTPYEFLQQQ